MWTIRRINNRAYELKFENVCSMLVKIEETKRLDAWIVILKCIDDNKVCCTLSYIKRATPKYDHMTMKFNTAVTQNKEESMLMYTVLGTCADFVMRDTGFFYNKTKEIRWD